MCFLKARTEHRLKVAVSNLQGKAAILLSSLLTSQTTDEDDVMCIDAAETDDECTN